MSSRSVSKTRMTKLEYIGIQPHAEVLNQVSNNMVEAFWFERCVEGELPPARNAPIFSRNVEYGKLCMTWKTETTDEAMQVTNVDPLLDDVDDGENTTALTNPDLVLYLYPQHTMLCAASGKQMPVARHHPATASFMEAVSVEFLCVTEVFNEHASDTMARASRVVLPAKLYTPSRARYASGLAYLNKFESVHDLLPALQPDDLLKKKVAAILTAQALNGNHTRLETAQFKWTWDDEKLLIASPW